MEESVLCLIHKEGLIPRCLQRSKLMTNEVSLGLILRSLLRGVSFGINYTTGENDYLEVEWSSAEAIDFPVVNYEFDNIGLSGSYSYSYMLEAN